MNSARNNLQPVYTYCQTKKTRMIPHHSVPIRPACCRVRVFTFEQNPRETWNILFLIPRTAKASWTLLICDLIFYVFYWYCGMKRAVYHVSKPIQKIDIKNEIEDIVILTIKTFLAVGTNCSKTNWPSTDSQWYLMHQTIIIAKFMLMTQNNF